MWFKENKACNFSLNCPLWFWFFFFPSSYYKRILQWCWHTRQEFFEILFYFLLLPQQLLGCCGVRWIVFWKGGGLLPDNFEAGFEGSYFQGSSTSGWLSYRISKGLHAFSLQKPFDLSLGKSKRGYSWLGRTGYSVLFENCFPSSHNKLIS